jgi:hypothetical protein
MDIVAGRAAHLCRRAEAFTALKQPDLIAVNIGMLYSGRWERFEEFAERASWNVRESGRQSFSLNPVVAFGAQIDLPVA